MKYARLVLKWMLPIGAILILLNGAYIGLKMAKLTSVDIEVKSKSEDVNTYGTPVYFVFFCPADNKEIECRSTQVSKSRYDELVVGEKLDINIRPLLFGSFGKFMWYGLCLLVTTLSLLGCFAFGSVYILWWVYKE